MSDTKALWNAAHGVLDSLTDDGVDPIDQGLILCFALVLHKKRHNPALGSNEFLRLIDTTLEVAMADPAGSDEPPDFDWETLKRMRLQQWGN